MKIEFHPEAEQELREAAKYYENNAPGVGITFITDLYKSVKYIKQYPLASKEIGYGIRKKVLDKFPYKVLYSIEKDTILIIAIAHQKRRPEYWQSRL